jgi:hypothetical protein
MRTELTFSFLVCGKCVCLKEQRQEKHHSLVERKIIIFRKSKTFQKPPGALVLVFASFKTMKIAACLSMLMVLVSIFVQAQSQAAIAITGFQLVNTTSGSVFGNLTNGSKLYSATLPTNWTIVALATSATKSVAFNLDGNATFRTENAHPWSLTGDDNAGIPPTYFPWKPVPSTGSHTLIATPYNRTKRNGTAGTPYAISFSIATSAAPVPAPRPAPRPVPAPRPAPRPAPVPAPRPAPVPVPVPAPRPAPVPAPVPLPLPAPVPASPAILRIEVNTLNRQHSISPYLVGLHHEYTFTNDSAFQEGGVFVNWVKNSGVSTSRFPGGSTVKYWDWENPTGQPFIDALDPAFNASRNPPDSTWMSLDEYLSFVNRTGIMPILGVNSAHGAAYNVEAEYIA